MTAKPLIRENENCYREPDPEGGKGFGLFRYMLKMDLIVPRVRLLAKNRSDGEFDMSKLWADERAHHDAIRAGKEPPKVAPRKDRPTDAKRVEYQLNAPVKLPPVRRWGFISEEGARTSNDPVWLNIYTGRGEGGFIEAIEANEYSPETAFYVSIFLTDERTAWLMDQLERRPRADFHVRLEIMAFQSEVDHRLSEPWQMQTFYFEKQPHQITGVTFYLNDPELAALPPSLGDENEPAGNASALTPIHDDRLLKRLIGSVGWVVGLLILILLVLVFRRG
jgi:hypothetical protein